MRTDDPASYTEDKIWGDYNGDKTLWNHGTEQWCNMEGQYVHIVADLSHMAGKYAASISKQYEMALCNLGLFGTRYVRSRPAIEYL